jgi:hypothetical protein
MVNLDCYDCGICRACAERAAAQGAPPDLRDIARRLREALDDISRYATDATREACIVKFLREAAGPGPAKGEGNP